MRLITRIFFFLLIYSLTASVHAEISQPIKSNDDILWQAYKSGKFDIACNGWKQRARENSTVNQFNYGFCLEMGLNNPPRPSEASIWYGKAAEAGLPQAQHNLGLLRAEGRGVRKDIILAYFWLKVSSQKLISSRKALNNLHKSQKFSKDQIRKINQLLRAYYYKN